MIASLADFAASLLICGGLFFFLVAAVGLWRLKDPMCKGHAVAKSSVLGVSLILLALFFEVEGRAVQLLLLATILFQFLTIPISSHLYGRLVYIYRKQESKME